MTMQGDSGSPVQGLVSAIVLSLNRKAETIACLESLFGQTYINREIIVLDNASVDGSREALEKWSDRIGLLLMPRNHGDWEGRDIALKECRGEFVIIVDNDATVQPDCFEKLVTALRADDRLGAVQPKIVDPGTGSSYRPGFEGAAVDTRFYKAVFHGCVTMFRARALRAAGGFPHFLLGGAEDYISLRFHELGYRVLYEPAVVVRHLKSPKERVPFFRLQQQSRQKMRAKMSLAPSVPFAIGVFSRAVTAFCYHAVKGRYLIRLPGGILAHVRSGYLALRERSPISREAFRIYARLKRTMHPVPALLDEEPGVEVRNGTIIERGEEL